MTKILAFAGSLREGSYNKKLVRLAMKAAEEAGGDISYIDFASYPLPLYDGDLEKEKGIPENARKLRCLFKEADAFLISSPEYNSSIPGTFKNIIDWVSRPDGDIPSLVGFKGKVAAIMSASIGALGGRRGLNHLRDLLGNIGVMLLPNQVCVSKAHDAFNVHGYLKDEEMSKSVADLAKNLVKINAALTKN